MSNPVSLRGDFKASQLRALARKTKDGPQARRLLALAAIYDGATRTEAARIGGVTLQIVRDWVVKFNSHGPDGLIDRKAPGQSSVLAETRSDRQCLIERSDFGVRRCQAAIIFSFVIGIASRNVCIGVLPKHQRP